MKEPILKSFYSENFESISSTNSIFLLTETDAKKIWNDNVDHKAKSYFRLSDDNWIIQSEQTLLGYWMDDFNQEVSVNVQNILVSAVDWNDNDIIWYCINRSNILESKWCEFKKWWIGFISCDDDCPIIINSSCKNEAIIFRPIGTFLRCSSAGRPLSTFVDKTIG